MLSDAPEPLVGRTILTPADGPVLIKAGSARFGFFNQPRVLAYCAEFAIIAAALALAGYRLAAEPLLAIAIGLFVVAIWVGMRTTRRLAADVGHGQQGEIELDDDAVTVRQPGLTSRWLWSRFERAIEAPDHITLVGGANVVVVFTRSFDAGTFARVRALIAAKLPASGQR